MVRAFVAAFRACGGTGDAPVDGFLARQGRRFDEILDELGLPPEMWERFVGESRARAGGVVVFPGVTSLLGRLQARGLPLAVFTAKDRLRTDELLELLGLRQRFDAVVTATDGLPPKPAPHGVWAILERLGVPAARAFLVGDAEADVQAAVAAGVRAIGAGWGIGAPQALLDVGACAIASTPGQVDGLVMALQRTRPATAR